MRRIASLGLLFVLAAAPAAVQGQQALVGMYPAGVGLDSGQQAAITIVADLRPGGYVLGSYQFQVTWNPAVLRYVRTTSGAFGAPTVNETAASSGTLTLAGASPAGGTGLISLAELTFEMTVSSGTSPVTVVAPELTAVTFGSIPTTGVPGDVCTSAGTWGDVNNDGSVLSNDALLVVTAAVGLPITPFTLANADVDADGDADTRDALVILSSAVGLSTPGFRVGTPSGGACAGAPAVALTVVPGALTLTTGDVAPVAALLYDAGGNPTSGTGLVWSSDAPGVATVDSAGRVTAVGNGVAAITAMAIGVSPTSAGVTVQDRHTWYVDATVAALNTVHVGSQTYPFPDIQSALDRAPARDTVFVVPAPTPYGAAAISKPVTLIGDSGAAGMPRLRNAAGTAITTNAPGLVTLRHFAIEESNAALDARGDSLIVQSVTAASLRDVGMKVRGMQYASLWDVSVNSAVLAGILADSNVAVTIDGAKIRVIASRNDSAVAVAVLHSTNAVVRSLDVLGVENGAAAVITKAAHGTLDNFVVQSAGGVTIDSVRAMYVYQGRVFGTRGSGDVALSIHADTVSVDTTIITGADQGIAISPIARDTLMQPNSWVVVDRTTLSDVAGPSGLVVERFDTVAIARTRVTNVQGGQGIDVRRATHVRIDSAVVSGVASGIGVQVVANPGAPSVLTMRGGKLRGHEGGLSVNYVRTVALTGVEIDSSAFAPQFCFPCTPKFGLQIWSPDSVQLDSLNIHDNSGAGAYVDSARVIVGAGSALLRNQGFMGLSGGDCQFGCEQQLPPLRRSTQSAQFTLSSFPAIVLNRTQDTRLSGWSVQDNPGGGLFFTSWDVLSGPTAQITNSSFQGLTTGTLLSALGNPTVPSGQLTVQGSTFRRANQAVVAQNLDRFDLTGSHIDSVGVNAYAGIQVIQVHNVQLLDDTLVNGFGWGFQVVASDTADVLRNVIRDGHPIDVNSQEAALELNSVSTGRIYGNRLERNVVRGIIVRNGSGPMTIDSNVVADDSGFAALQLHQPATVTRNLFARNSNGVYIDFGGEPSQIHQNNFQGNVFHAIRNESNDITNASANYWNAADGPRCAGAASGCGSASGDVVYGLNFGVDFSGYYPYPDLTGAPLGLPPLRAARRGATR